MNVAIYSALYGKYEDPKPLPDLGVPAYMFTDEPDLAVAGWTTVYCEPHPLIDSAMIVDLAKSRSVDPAATEPMMVHKYWKTHPDQALPLAEISIWLDASMEVIKPNFIQLCLDALGTDDWVVVTHPWRNCIFLEADYSATLPRYDAACLKRQSDWYHEIGHPLGWGLFATGAMIRRHTPIVKEVSENWWQECVNWSHQDQVSLPVLFRLAEELKWNTAMPWNQWWENHPHIRTI